MSIRDNEYLKELFQTMVEYRDVLAIVVMLALVVQGLVFTIGFVVGTSF